MSQRESQAAENQKHRVSDTFDGAARTFDRVGPKLFSHFGKTLVDVAGISPGSRVLDIATGRGAVLFPAAEAVGADGTVIGIDLSREMVKETTHELAEKKFAASVEVHQMDAENLRFQDESFDDVLCGFAIFFFPQLNLAMSELIRVLKPGGQICLSTFERSYGDQWKWLDEIVEKTLNTQNEDTKDGDSDPPPKPEFDTPEGIKAILSSAGFSEIQVELAQADFIYETAEIFWASLNSYGYRRILGTIEAETGKEGLARFKGKVLEQFNELKEIDGLHQNIPVLITHGKKRIPG